MNCNQKGCDALATYRFTWPGTDEAGICEKHAPQLQRIAEALGLRLSLELIPEHVSEGADLESLISHGLVANTQFETDTGEDGMLDDAVHDAASQIGSVVNNEGVESQIRFLAERLGVEEAGKVIDAATEDTG